MTRVFSGISWRKTTALKPGPLWHPALPDHKLLGVPVNGYKLWLVPLSFSSSSLPPSLALSCRKLCVVSRSCIIRVSLQCAGGVKYGLKDVSDTRGVFFHCSEARATKIIQEVSGLVITALIPAEMSGAKARTFGGFNRDTFNALSTRRRESSLKRDSVNCTWRWYPESFRAPRAWVYVWASYGTFTRLSCISVEYHSTFLATCTTLGRRLRREIKTDAKKRHHCCNVAAATVPAHLRWLC